MVSEMGSHGILQNRGNRKVQICKPEQWETWIRRFKHFRNASGLKSKTDEERISHLIYSLEDKADLLQSFKMSDEDAAKYNKVLQCYEDYFNKVETLSTNEPSSTTECSRKKL